MKGLKWINAAAFAAMIAVNALANLLPMGGNTTGQVSEAYPNLFTPAPITFSIWGLIYLLMLFFILYQFGLLDSNEGSTEVREKTGLLFVFSCFLNIAWIFLWHYHQIGISTICILLLLITLIMIVRRMKSIEADSWLRMVVRAGFSLYFGWIIAAVIANISVYLTQIGWNGWGLSPVFWTAAVLLIGAGISAAVAQIGENRIAALAVMWAYGGVLIRHVSSTFLDGAYPMIIAAALVSEAVILAAILVPPACIHKQTFSPIES